MFHIFVLVFFTALSYRSWQTLKFDKQPASFIRIVGTHNTANEVKTQFIMLIRLLPFLFLML